MFQLEKIQTKPHRIASALLAILTVCTITGCPSRIIVNKNPDDWCKTNEHCGTITDSRDGQQYPWVQIGAQKWMARNLNFMTQYSHCYDDSLQNCENFGRLYNWADAMGYPQNYNKGHVANADPFFETKPFRGICPEGWSIPSSEDFINLRASVKQQNNGEGVGVSLSSTTGWINDGNGSDYFRFNARPSGARSTFHTKDVFKGWLFAYWTKTQLDVPQQGMHWSDTPQQETSPRAVTWMGFFNFNGFERGSFYMNIGDMQYKGDFLSVRCIKNRD